MRQYRSRFLLERRPYQTHQNRTWRHEIRRTRSRNRLGRTLCASSFSFRHQRLASPLSGGAASSFRRSKLLREAKGHATTRKPNPCDPLPTLTLQFQHSSRGSLSLSKLSVDSPLSLLLLQRDRIERFCWDNWAKINVHNRKLGNGHWSHQQLSRAARQEMHLPFSSVCCFLSKLYIAQCMKTIINYCWVKRWLTGSSNETKTHFTRNCAVGQIQQWQKFDSVSTS